MRRGMMGGKKDFLKDVSNYRIVSTATVYGQKAQTSGWQSELLRGATSVDS